MFLGLSWYVWLLILVVFIISIPLKFKFMKWWGEKQQEKKMNNKDKWGGEE
jgi:hypothetical protein